MRGHPILRLVILICFLSIAGIPVFFLTRKRPESVSSALNAEPAPKKIIPYDITLTASPPAHLTVSAIGQKALESSPAADSLSATFTMDSVKPEDLVVKARFASSQNNTALRVEVRVAGKTLTDATLWGGETIEDVVSIPAP